MKRLGESKPGKWHSILNLPPSL